MATLMNVKRAEQLAAALKSLGVPEYVVKPLNTWVKKEKTRFQNEALERQKASLKPELEPEPAPEPEPEPESAPKPKPEPETEPKANKKKK